MEALPQFHNVLYVVYFLLDIYLTSAYYSLKQTHNY